MVLTQGLVLCSRGWCFGHVLRGQVSSEWHLEATGAEC